ncbi:GNAT family N-acetyltransferase [Pseudahrensia aquimaris]|uniref:GNAT family N-acetyltransferase n=1 Tax=Pseudahrensia aquimaris TaxID=744461 RepID=A0ABW3FEH2_9HYPH
MQAEMIIRPTEPRDVGELCQLLNEIIEQGGTTARRQTMSETEFLEHYVTNPISISCVTAQAADGTLLGFQTLHLYDWLPSGWADIGTFARVGSTAKGIGTRLFQSTLQAAADRNISTINATIRSYNIGGLKYYGKMGFVEYKREEAEPLEAGQAAEKVFKKRAV